MSKSPVLRMEKSFDYSDSLRETPLYTTTEVARYLRVPASTVRAWAFGQGYQTSFGRSSALQIRPVSGYRS